jgi:hypothetical protein
MTFCSHGGFEMNTLRPLFGAAIVSMMVHPVLARAELEGLGHRIQVLPDEAVAATRIRRPERGLNINGP